MAHLNLVRILIVFLWKYHHLSYKVQNDEKIVKIIKI